jgi:hypothetical protein
MDYETARRVLQEAGLGDNEACVLDALHAMAKDGTTGSLLSRSCTRS